MEGRNLKACVTELPALQPSPSTSDSSLTLQLHKGTLQQSYSENSILNTRKQRHTHAKEETKQKKKAHALSRLWLCKITYSESNGTGYVFIMYPKFLHLPHPRTTACPQRLSLHILSSETTEKRPQQKKKNLPRGSPPTTKGSSPPPRGQPGGVPPPRYTRSAQRSFPPRQPHPQAGPFLPTHTDPPPPLLPPPRSRLLTRSPSHTFPAPSQAASLTHPRPSPRGLPLPQTHSQASLLPPPPRSPHTEAPPHPGPQEAVAAGPTPRGQGRGRQGRAGQAGSRRGPALLTFRELQLQLGQLFADLAGQRGDSRGRRFGHGGWKEIRKEKANPAAGSARLRLSAGGSESRAQRERPPPPPC